MTGLFGKGVRVGQKVVHTVSDRQTLSHTVVSECVGSPLVGQFIDRAGHTSYHYLIQKLSVVYKLLRVNVTTMSID